MTSTTNSALNASMAAANATANSLANVTTVALNSLSNGAKQQPLTTWSFLTEEITQTKLIASLVLFVITLLFGYLPVRIILNQNYIQHAMFAGGGVLMATAFCHLIPEAHDGYRNSNSHQNAAHSHDHHEHHHQAEHEALHSVVQNGSTLANTTTKALNESLQAAAEGLAEVSATGGHSNHVPYPEILLCCGFIFMYVVEQLFLRFVNNHTHEHPGDTSTGQLIGSQPKRLSAGEIDDKLSIERGNATTGTGITEPSNNQTGATAVYKFVRGLLIVSAFSMHSIFDGVAIGSQDSVEKVWTIFFAISCHKLIIVAVVGFELYSATLESHLWTLVHLTIFSIMSPIGILLVIIAQNSLKVTSDDPVMILLQSFATGTLLYIIFVEILQPKEDRFHTRNRSTKILSLIVGFALMVAVVTLMHGD